MPLKAGFMPLAIPLPAYLLPLEASPQPFCASGFTQGTHAAVCSELEVVFLEEKQSPEPPATHFLGSLS